MIDGKQLPVFFLPSAFLNLVRSFSYPCQSSLGQTVANYAKSLRRSLLGAYVRERRVGNVGEAYLGLENWSF